MSCCRPEIHDPHATLVHWLVLFHGMTTFILEIDCVALREQRLHVHLWPAKAAIRNARLAIRFKHSDTAKLRKGLRFESAIQNR